MNFKRLKEEIEAQYPFKVELHAHSMPASGCSQVSPEELVDIYADIGYPAMVLTNHFYYFADVSAEEYVDRFLNDFARAEQAGIKRGMRVYLGAELRFTESNNDYLLFGVNREMLLDIYPRLTDGVERFRKDYPLPNSVFVQAHPKRDGIEEVDASLLDGIEALNMHPGHNARVGVALRYATQNKLPIVTAGSDFHHPNKGHEGLCAARVAALPEDGFALAKLLKDGDFVTEVSGYFVI